jgi:ubiquinone/menaquinone biosynthesis C-methylase UbiE
MNESMVSSVLDKEVLVQREYYAKTASNYDSMHVSEKDEHYFALRFLEAVIEFYEIKSLLDIGAGTGRVARYLKAKIPSLKIVSVEPVGELREVGYQNGLSREELINGDATNLPLNDRSFDLVCEFGVLHHVKDPALAVKEMLRVCRRGIFISDSNNFGQGSYLARSIKQTLNFLGLWWLADYIKTRGKGYTISDGDGLAYSYSVFNNYRQIADQCHTHIVNTQPAGINPYKTAPHLALVGIKRFLT